MREITIKEIKESSTETWSRKNNSVRGIETVDKKEINVGDKIVINNYFTLVTE